VNPNYRFVAARAKHICEYCHAPEAVFNLPFEVEHIIPSALGGKNEESNLALSCRSCNLYKSDSVSFFDEETGKEVRFFNPRKDVWSEHFFINKTSGEMQGLTKIGKATISRLRINSDAQRAARFQWLKLGFFD
jgi:hypothetical protein